VEDIDDNPSVSLEDESAHVMQFKWSDFRILDRVSIGHGGRVLPNLMIVKCFLSFFWISFSLTFTFLQADELVFEAIVQVPDRSVSTSYVLQDFKMNFRGFICGASISQPFV